MAKFPLIPLAIVFAFGPLLSGQSRTPRTTASISPRGPSSWPPVPNAPFCADEVSESQRILKDGTQHTQTSPAVHRCRDAAGRDMTKFAMSIPLPDANPAPNMDVVSITDPVAGVLCTLDMQHKVAHCVTLALVMSPVFRPVRRTSNSLSPGVPLPRPVTESLGTKTLNGVLAEGTLQTQVVPGNVDGTVPSSTVTNESWWAPEMRILLVQKRSDSNPRNGLTIRRLDNLTLGPPDPALFQIPPDYQIVNETAPFTITYSRQ